MWPAKKYSPEAFLPAQTTMPDLYRNTIFPLIPWHKWEQFPHFLISFSTAVKGWHF
jgi:hypothetical protein